jgi:hypothetical protein
MPDDFEMDRFEWFLVLQAFYEENLGFEFDILPALKGEDSRALGY